MSANRFPAFNTQFRDDTTDDVAAFYLLYTYISGTTTNKTTYTDAAGVTENTNPIVLDSTGRCTIFGDTDAAYTFVLKTPDGLTTVKTWDSVSTVPDAATTGYVLKAGDTMTGLLTLSGDATASLNPVTKQQMDTAITASTATVTAAVAAATDAAAAATAAAAAIAPTSFRLFVGSGSSATRTVTLAAGTWQVAGQTFVSFNDAAGGNFNVTATQAFTCGTTTVNTSVHLLRSGGSGYGREVHGTGLSVGTLTVATTASFTMTIAAPSLTGTGGPLTSNGAILTLEKTS
jgi:hypothetical protein